MSVSQSERARMGGRIRNALQPGGPDGMAHARAAVRAKFEAAVEVVEPGLPLPEIRKRGDRLRGAWLETIAYQAARKRRGEPYVRVTLDAWIAARIAKAKATKNISEADRAAMRARRGRGSPAAFEDAVLTVESPLPAEELRNRARQLRVEWLGSVAREGLNKRYGRPYEVLELDAWLAARVASATKNGTASEVSEEAIPSSEERDERALSPEEERRVGDVLESS